MQSSAFATCKVVPHVFPDAAFSKGKRQCVAGMKEAKFFLSVFFFRGNNQ
jgi:hypothetical protein